MSERILTLPRLGETMAEGKVVGWLIQPGEHFRRGDSILEIETDKTIAELPALGDGRLDEVLVTIGDVVEVGQPLARIDIGDGPDWTREEDNKERENYAGDGDDEGSAAMQAETHATPGASVSQDKRLRATPLARRLARHHGLNLATIAGTGRRGRIEKTDVLAAVGGDTPAADTYFVALRHGRMAYADSDPHRDQSADADTGMPLLLLHGFAGDHSTWAAIASGLQRAGRRVIVPDLPGHGLTEIEAQDVTALARDLPEFLDALGIAAVDVVAHSLGTVAALALAQLAPVRVGSLSLIAPVGLGLEIDGDFVHGLAHTQTPGELAHFLRRLSLNAVEPSEAALAALARQLARGRLVALAEALVGTRGSNGTRTQKIDTLAAIAKLSSKLPVRVLFGLEDRIIPWQQILALPPTVAIHLLARSGHMPQWDQSRDVLDILTIFNGEGYRPVTSAPATAQNAIAAIVRDFV